MGARRGGAVLLTIGFGFVMALAGTASASDTSTAKKLVITQADVGPGYTAEPQQPSKNLISQVAKCEGKSVAKRKVTASVNGDVLTNTTGGSVIASSAEIVKTKAMATADRAVFSNGKFPDCVKQSLESSGETVIYVQRDPILELSRKKYGEFSDAIAVQLHRGNQFVHITEVGIAKGRAELDAQIISTSGTVQASALTNALDQLNKRLKKAKV